ncbi:Tim44 domain-containing protein [Quisquiliibacterium transsilvanicum]|jgi:predicted lipid-binding transport protein (Tim44 family)|uniref:Putative lipid-binding transport protein (Tim44 family) n=1 Tax=Quisquiliibacterium transsilvanicum TaxID=1549638 RepID=A0A7W8HJI4_9BURK|nr:TIM44-like domain-containing protein [Quisquiliibacterium transsilvanicum]MBB5273037.1 putative lipid-binding transport protein (Tim44 family) [Quisquiliibacterium transsilvanicum]
MKILGKFLAVGLVSVAFFAAEAEAKRLGGGKSFGRQSNTATQRDATPAQQNVTPSQSAQTQAAARQNPAAASAAQPARNRWLGPVAGLAAGLGLAALASHLGLGEELASMMLILLMVVAAVVVVRMVMARRAQPRPAFQTAGYPADGVGSEASVRFSPLPRDQGGSARPGTPVVGPAAAAAPDFGAQARIPDGFDVEGFVRNAKVQFVRLQAAFDAGDVNDLREFTSPEMFAELKMQIGERQGEPNRTDVVRLDAELLGIESSQVDHVASVRFWGLVRENEAAPAEPIDEVWNLVKPVSGQGGWVLAGIQQLG